jgi:hypothetical protein
MGVKTHSDSHAFIPDMHMWNSESLSEISVSLCDMHMGKFKEGFVTLYRLYG